jgi:hypothetical protein
MTNAAEAFWSTVQKGLKEKKAPSKASRQPR